MDKPDLSKLTDTEKQDLTIKLLFDVKAMLTTLMDGEIERRGAAQGIAFEQADDQLHASYLEHRKRQWLNAGVAPTTDVDSAESAALTPPHSPGDES